MKNILFISLLLLAASGCKPLVESLISTRQGIRNDFDQRVSLEVYDRGQTKEAFELDPGEEKVFVYSDDSPLPLNFEFSDSVRFVFADGKAKTDLTPPWGDDANILNDEQYIQVDSTYWYSIDSLDYQEAN